MDVAGPGEDETALCIRAGDAILSLQAWKGIDARGAVLAALAPYRERLGPGSVRVDEVGMGYYFARHLADALGAERVAGVNVGTAPLDRERFADRKAEVYWALRDRLAAGELCGLTDATAYAQAADVQYRHDPRGRVVIESKGEVRRRTGASPDRLEAVILAFAPAVRPPSTALLTGALTRTLVRQPAVASDPRGMAYG